LPIARGTAQFAHGTREETGTALAHGFAIQSSTTEPSTMMIRTLTSLSFLSLLTAASLTGCAAEAPGGDDDGYTDDGGPSDGNPDTEPVPLTPTGTFRVESQFDLATNVPGTAGEIANYFILATDDPDDPTKFIVEKLIAALPAGSIKNTAEDAAPLITGYLNDRLLEIAPELLTKVIDIGDAFGQVARNFGTIETLQISSNGQTVKTVTGVKFKVDEVDLEFPFADYNMDDIKVEGLNVTLDQTGKLAISEHTIGLSYGQVLRLALDQAIIPFIDPSASNLGDILHSLVNCESVGQYVYDAIDIGSPSTFENACNAGLTAAAAALYRQLENIDGSALEFGMAGVARGVDTNRDGAMDDIKTGTWSGNLGYAGTPAPLGQAKFFGESM
jgi:hypothetical protein